MDTPSDQTRLAPSCKNYRSVKKATVEGIKTEKDQEVYKAKMKGDVKVPRYDKSKQQ